MRVFTQYRIQNVATPHKIFQPPAQRVCQGQTRPDDHGEEDRFYCATAMWFLCSCLKFVGNRDCVASLLGLDYAIATWLSRPHTVASQAQNQTWEAGICGYELWGSSELSYGYHCHSINGIHIPCFMGRQLELRMDTQAFYGNILYCNFILGAPILEVPIGYFRALLLSPAWSRCVWMYGIKKKYNQQ